MQHFTGKQYLQIDIANNFGLDKKSWKERLNWFDANKDQLIELLPQADEPALYYAGVQAWFAALKGEQSGYPISLDATSSGLQLLAALTGDRQAAQLCNVVDTGDREDAYYGIYQAMLAKTGGSAKIRQEDCKTAVMTALYGSKAEPKRVFGEGNLLQVFYDTMSEYAPAAWELNQFFIDIWDANATINSWVLPDNFHVHVKVMVRVKEDVNFLEEPFETFRDVNAPMAEGRSLGANTIHSLDGMIVREMARRCDYNKNRIADIYQLILEDIPCFLNKPEAEGMVEILWKHYQESGYLSARILDYLDSTTIHLVDAKVIYELLESLPKKPFKVISVHDCFRCLPNYGNDLREQYNNQLVLIAKSNLLQYLIGQIMGRQVSIGKLDQDLWKDIKNAEYALS